MPTYTPAQVVEETGLSIDTLRYYERIGLLDDVDRTPAGQRRFTDEHLSWLSLVRCLRESGMPIAEVVRFTQLTRQGDHTIPDRIALLKAHDRRVSTQIAALHDQRRYLHRKISYFENLSSP